MLFISSTLLLLVNAVTLRRERSILFNRVAVLILLYSGIICYDSLNITSLDTGIGIYGGLFHSTSITHSFDLFVCIIGAIVLQLTAYYPRRLQEPMGATGKKKSFFLTNYASSSLEKSKNNMGEQSEVRKFSTLIPFLKKYPLQGSKLRDFADFVKAAALMYSKDHLTIAGLDKIVNIKKGMNQLRQMSSMATAAVQPELNTLKKERETLGWALIPEYPLVILFILIGAIFLMSSSDLVSMFLAIELQSYGLYIFATLYRNSELATSAGLTYFLLGGLSSCFILLGSCLLYLNFGITNLDGLYVLSSLSEVNGLEVLVETNQYFNLALLIMSVGYLFKVSAAPAVWCRKSLLWVKLSNSGNLLKLIISSYIWKNISGWSNYSGKVKSYKMSENEMDNRGSKSVVVSTLDNAIVKEKRVNGSWHGVVPSKVRCTLIGFSLNYRVKILTKGSQITYKSHYGRSYTSIVRQDLIPNLIMNPWFATGFSDGESCFTLSVFRNKERKVGWRVSHCFQITIHKKDLVLLEQIQSYFLFLIFLVGSIITLFDIDPFLLCAIIPIKSYSNAEADKGKILKENQNKSGIYIWKNLVNKKQYIGSSDEEDWITILILIIYLQRICMYILVENIIILQPLLGFILDLFLGSLMQNQALSY